MFVCFIIIMLISFPHHHLSLFNINNPVCFHFKLHCSHFEEVQSSSSVLRSLKDQHTKQTLTFYRFHFFFLFSIYKRVLLFFFIWIIISFTIFFCFSHKKKTNPKVPFFLLYDRLLLYMLRW